MKLKRIKIENFVLFEEEDIEFDDNLFFISGRNNVEANQSSNGAGKSLLATSIVWGLFEENLRKGMTRDDVIGPFGDSCCVLLEFELDGKEVVIERSRSVSGSGSVELFVNGNDRSHPTSKRKTTQRILDVFGIPSKDVFYHAAFQEDTKPPLVSLTPSELKGVISDILDISRYDNWARQVRSEAGNANRELGGIDDLIASQENTVSVVQDQVSDLKSDIEEFEDKKEEKLTNLEEKRQKLEVEIEDLRSGILQKEDKIRESFGEKKEKKDKFDIKKQKVNRAKKEEEDCKKELEKLKNKAQRVCDKRDQAKENFENLTKNPSGRCNVCGNYLQDSDKLEEKIEKYQKEVDKYQSKYVDVKYDFEAKKKEYKRKKEKRKNLQEKVGDRQEELSKFFKLKSKLEKIDDVIKPKIQEYKDNVETVNEKIDHWEQKTVDDKVRKLESKKNRLEEERYELQDLKDRKGSLQKDVKICEYLDAVLKSIKVARYNSFMLRFERVIQKNLDDLTGGDFACSIQADGDEVEMLFTNSSKDQYLRWSVFSKGERKRISKAVFMALNQVMGLNFIVDDEGVDGIDNGSVKDMIRFMLRDDDKMVFLVSHRTEAQDYCNHATNLHVEKNEVDGQLKSSVYLRQT